MKKEETIQILSEYKELQELKAKAEKRYRELKEVILAEINAGKYGSYVVTFEDREVKEYTVPARTDHLVKVGKI